MNNTDHTPKPQVVAIHQPNFLPWPGFFYKWMKSQMLVLLDDVQFIKRSIINRVKIKTPQGESWLTIPVIQKGRYHQTIAETEIQHALDWKKKVLGSIEACYGKAPFFPQYYPALKIIIQGDHELLVDINVDLIKWTAREIGIQVPLTRSSELQGVTGTSSERLASICKALGADRYLSGFGGQKYQEEDVFKEYNIELMVYDFSPPLYPQLFGDFIPGLSTLDLLMNCGPQSRDILLSGGGTPCP